MSTASPEPFLRNWKALTFEGHLNITSRDGNYYAEGDNRVHGPLEWDPHWKNLRSDSACFSLHGQKGGLFGLFQEKQVYRSVAAFLEGSRHMPAPDCGRDSDLFRKHLLAREFRVRTVQANRLPRPVEPGDTIAIRHSPARDGYILGTLSPMGFREIDTLCPHAENGNLESHAFGEKSMLRCVTYWAGGEARGRLFSMVTIGREAAQAATAAAGNSSPGDLPTLAASLGLLVFELQALADLDIRLEPGDPLIVWGADDGGG